MDLWIGEYVAGEWMNGLIDEWIGGSTEQKGERDRGELIFKFWAGVYA